MVLTVVPAYGRDYKSAKEVKAAWDEDKDFRIDMMFDSSDGRYINRQDAPKGATINVRYNFNRKVVVIKVA
jgi:hypothetical protein